MKKFLDGFIDAMESFGFVVGGAIGGMVLMKGMCDGNVCSIIIGSMCIIVNMFVNKIGK